MRSVVFSLLVLVTTSCSTTNREQAATASTAIREDVTTSVDADADAEILAGHSLHGEAFNEGPRQSAYRMSGTGEVHWSVTTSNPRAQEFFDQGLGQLYGFWYFEAERTFRQVAQLDPNCAMAYWGMALANLKNEKRAKGFCAKALPLIGNVSDRERRHIEAVTTFFQSTDKKAEREKQFVAALQDICDAYPDDIETHALLVRYRWEYRKTLKPKTEDIEADEKKLQSIFAQQANHPAHHFRIHLWDDKDAKRALISAAQCGQAAPGIAHMWHMPGHTYSKLKRYDDAAWQQEASARVDHAQMQRDHIMPDQIHNYAHNNEWLCRNLMALGRVYDAIALAENMRSLPRHPKYNKPEKGSGKYGTQRLYDIYYQYELWDDLIHFSDAILGEETTSADDRVAAQTAKGIAYCMLKRSDEADAQRQVIADLIKTTEAEREAAVLKAKDNPVNEEASEDEDQDEAEQEKKDDKKKKDSPEKKARKPFDARIKKLTNALTEIDAHRFITNNKVDEARKQLKKAKDIPKWRLASYYQDIGDVDEAEKIMSTWAKEKGQEMKVQPVAQLAWLLWQQGKQDEAITAFNSLRDISSYCDIDQPIFARLASIAAAAKVPSDWRLPITPANVVGVRPDLATLGPFRWQPTPAKPWTCSDADGRERSLAEYRGKPVIVIFYLGAGCLHCIEQLHAFAPKAAAFRDAGIELVGISTDAQRDLHRSITAADKNGIFPIPLVADPTLEIFKSYRAYDDFERQPLHGTFLIDEKGFVRWQDISFEPFMETDFLLAEAKRLLSQ